MDVVASASRPAVFASYSASLHDLRALANALPADPLYAASAALYASTVLPQSSVRRDLDGSPTFSFPHLQGMPPLPLDHFDSSRIAPTDRTAIPGTAAQADSQQASFATAQTPVLSSSFPPPAASFSRMQLASYNAPASAFPSSPHSAYSNSPNTPLGFGHASPAVASPALDARMIQQHQGAYISSLANSQSYGTPVTTEFPVQGGCAPLDHTQLQQHRYYTGAFSSHGMQHRKSSSVGSTADALGLQHASYSTMATDESSGVTHSPALFGSPRFTEPQAGEQRLLAGSPVFAMRRPSESRRSSFGFSPNSPKLARSSFAPSSLGPASASQQGVTSSPMSDQMVLPTGHSPSAQNFGMLPDAMHGDGFSSDPPALTRGSPRTSFSSSPTPSSITPPSVGGLALSSPAPHSITIVRPKAPRKPKKQLPTPEQGLNKPSRGRTVPTQSELLQNGVWGGDITAAHNKVRIRERVKSRQNARLSALADSASAERNSMSDSAWDSSEQVENTEHEGSVFGNAMSASPDATASLETAPGHEAGPTVHVVSPRSYVCPVDTCSKAFKRREHLRRHLRSIHTNEKPHKCTHPGCTKSFSRTDNLWQHVKTHEGPGYRDVSLGDAGTDAPPAGGDGDPGWLSSYGGSSGSSLLHDPMGDASASTGLLAGSGSYSDYAPVHYEYSDTRQQLEPAQQQAQYRQHGMGSHTVPQQPHLWTGLPQAQNSHFGSDPSAFASSSISPPFKPYSDNGQQAFPHGPL